jgi:hypothetical protein
LRKKPRFSNKTFVIYFEFLSNDSYDVIMAFFLTNHRQLILLRLLIRAACKQFSFYTPQYFGQNKPLYAHTKRLFIIKRIFTTNVKYGLKPKRYFSFKYTRKRSSRRCIFSFEIVLYLEARSRQNRSLDISLRCGRCKSGCFARRPCGK